MAHPCSRCSPALPCRGASQAVALLMEFGADPSLRSYLGLSPLLMACLSGHDTVLDVLVAANVK